MRIEPIKYQVKKQAFEPANITTEHFQIIMDKINEIINIVNKLSERSSPIVEE